MSLTWITRRVNGNCLLVMLALLVLNLFVLHLIFEHMLSCNTVKTHFESVGIQQLRILTNNHKNQSRRAVTPPTTNTNNVATAKQRIRKLTSICGDRPECEHFINLQHSISKILTIGDKLDTNEYRTILRFQSFINRILPEIKSRKSHPFHAPNAHRQHDGAIISNDKNKKTEKPVVLTTNKIVATTNKMAANVMPANDTHIYSCPEIYKKSTYGYPYFLKGFIRNNCSRPHFNQSVSLILDIFTFNSKSLKSIVNATKRQFHKVFIITDITFKNNMTKDVLGDASNVQVMYKTEKTPLGQALNTAVRDIKTPYTLIASNIAKFDNWTDIERLIDVEETTGALFVGSAVKYVDRDGTWDRGCYQTKFNLYTLKYEAGYYESRFSCMYCNHVVSPFLTRTKTLTKYIFNDRWNHGVYRDLFFRIPEKQILVCPDVLFYLNTKHETDVQLSAFADEHRITRIVETDGKIRWFNRRRGFNGNLNHVCNTFKRSTAVSPDCRHNLLDGINFLLQQCVKHNLSCELQEGTLVGALKFHHILPWERDADITVLSTDFNKLHSLHREFAAKGYGMSIRSPTRCCFEGVTTGGSMAVYANGWLIEVWGQHRLTSLKSSRTKMKMGGNWVYTPENPGLYIRNRYGPEIYRHAEHWFSTGTGSGWAKYNAGVFLKCWKAGDHTCLDKFRADGDMHFKEWL